MSDKWNKYDYVCSLCDALIEITTKSNVYKPQVCCGEEAIWLSVVDATIPNKNPAPTKEIEMETETTELIDNSVLYQQLKEMRDRNATQDEVIRRLRKNVSTVENIILANYEDSSDQDTLLEIAQALDISLTKEITWTATVSITGTIEVNIGEDYDLESMVYDNLSSELYNYDFSIDSVDEN